MSKRPKTVHLAHDLVAAGQPPRCAVCRAVEPLEVHHVMPRAVLVACGREDVADAVENLVFLCRDHHALIERFYWWQRSLKSPRLCKDIVLTARAFRAKAFAQKEIPFQTERTRWLWTELNKLSHTSPLWWHAVFTKAVKWAEHQEILRPVPPSQAIVEEPWFRDRRTGVMPVEDDHELAQA